MILAAALGLTLSLDDDILDPRAKRIVEAMFDAYDACVTYSDTGTVTDPPSKVTIRFITRFKRPSKFYFEFTDVEEGRRAVMWCKGSQISKDPKDIPPNRVEGDFLQALSWFEGRPQVESDSLGDMVAGFTGISSGAIGNVSGMLFPSEVRMRNISWCKDLKFEKSETLRGVSCDVLYSASENERYWIAKKSHMLIRVLESGVLNHRIDFDPKVDRPILDSAFLFKVPKK